MMNNSSGSTIRTQSLLDRDYIVEASTSTAVVPPLRVTKSECPFSVEIEAAGGGDDIRLTSRSWSFSLTKKMKRGNLQWEQHVLGEENPHPCSNSVELVPVNSSSESEDSYSINDEEQNIVVMVEEEDDDNATFIPQSPSSATKQRRSMESHPLSRTKSTLSEQQQQQQQQEVALCAYDCFADHITSILCPVDRHHIETTSHKNLPLAEESSASVCSAKIPTPTTPAANDTSVCNPEAFSLTLFPPTTEPEDNEMDGSSFLFSSFNFWDSSAVEAQRVRLRRLELQQQRTPINRTRHSKKLRDRYLLQMSDTWYPPLQDVESRISATFMNEEDATQTSSSYTKSRLPRRSKSFSRRSKRRITSQPNNQVCYDSDPEQSYTGKRQRRKSLLQPERKRQPSSSSSSQECYLSSRSLHVGVLGESIDEGGASASQISNNSRRSSASELSIMTTEEDDSTSYETAHNNVQPPLAPRHGDRISFDFVTTDSDRHQDGGETTAEESAFTASRDSVISLSSAGDVNEEIAPQDQLTPAVTASESSIFSDTTSPEEHHKTHHEMHHVRHTSQQLHMPLPVRCEPPFFKAPTDWTEFHLLYSNMDDFTKAHVQELSNVRFPLIWHPPSDKKGSRVGSMPSKMPCPKACHGVFEVGAHLDHMVVQPKFTWSPVLQPNLEEDRKILLSGSQPHSVELLSIIRVNTPSPDQRPSLSGGGWNRSLYPFCRLDRTLCVTTNDLNHPYLVFEARSQTERDWLVVALKLIVARLASIIIVRDEDMLLEFFSPYSALLQLEDDEDSDDELEDTAAPGKRASARNAMDTLTLGKKRHRSPVQTIVRDDGEDGDRQDVSMDDDDLSSDDEE